MPDLSPWPIHTALWPKAPTTIDPTWSQWFSNLVNKVNTPKPVLFAHLPINPTIGQLATVTDSSTAVWGATIVGGGANQVLAHFNGVSWTVVAV